MAVLEKRANMNLGSQDVYLNVVSGIKISEPAIDLGIILAVASSFKNISIPKDLVAIGEVGLTGEVRAVNMIEKRLKEAEKLGFKKCIIPENNKKLLKDNYSKVKGFELLRSIDISIDDLLDTSEDISKLVLRR